MSVDTGMEVRSETRPVKHSRRMRYIFEEYTQSEKNILKNNISGS